MSIKNNTVFYLKGKWEDVYETYRLIKKYLGTTDLPDGYNLPDNFLHYIIKTGYSGDISELINDNIFSQEIVNAHNCQIDIIHNDYDDLKQSLYRLVEVDKGKCQWKNFEVSFSEIVRKYNEDEKELFMDQITTLFGSTEYYDCWDSPHFEYLFSIYHSYPKDLWDAIYEYVKDRRLLYETS